MWETIVRSVVEEVLGLAWKVLALLGRWVLRVITFGTYRGRAANDVSTGSAVSSLFEGSWGLLVVVGVAVAVYLALR